MGKWERERKVRGRERKREKRDHMSLHHVLPRSRDGKDIPTNLLRMWYFQKHRHWHALFGDRTLEEAIEFMKRVDRALKRKEA